MELCNATMGWIDALDNRNQSWRKDWNIDSRYTIQKILGNGSYGDVAKAIDTKTEETVGSTGAKSRLGSYQEN